MAAIGDWPNWFEAQGMVTVSLEVGAIVFTGHERNETGHGAFIVQRVEQHMVNENGVERWDNDTVFMTLKRVRHRGK